MNDNFILYRSVKDFSFEILNFIDNIPKSKMFIKTGIEEALFNSIKLIRYYVVNINDTYRIKIKYLKDLVVEISMVDYYLDYMFSNGYLGKNKYNSFNKELEEIRKIAYGVINSEKK